MKKKILLTMFAILCLSAFSLQAGIRIGVKGGVNLANATFDTNSFQASNFTGFQIGPIVEISSLMGLGVDAAVLYSQQGINLSWSQQLSYSDTYNPNVVNYELKSKTLDIPINLKFKFSLAKLLGIYLSAGPYASFKLDDQATFSQITNQVGTQWGSKQFGVGLNFGAGFELLKHLQIGANYQFALNDDYSNFSLSSDLQNFQAKTRIWSITATYFF